MDKKRCCVKIDSDFFEFSVEGDFFWGEEKLLYNAENNIISKTNWEHIGFSNVDVFKIDEFEALKYSVANNVKKALRINNINFDEKKFKLENYHELVTSDELHHKVIEVTRNLTEGDFNFDIEKLNKRFEDILGYQLTSWIEELNKTHIQIRINRPNSFDINPPHRDGYLSFWENIINVWVPIEGCNSRTSLPVLPKSHLLPENEIFRTKNKSAKINGNIYNVPCVLKTKEGMLNMIRPNPKQGQALIFTPFLIHGAALNNSEFTRVSLELRFPRKIKI